MLEEKNQEENVIYKILKIKDGIEKSFEDDVDFELECDVVATIEGETHLDCSSQASDLGYGNSKMYHWFII